MVTNNREITIQTELRGHIFGVMARNTCLADSHIHSITCLERRKKADSGLKLEAFQKGFLSMLGVISKSFSKTHLFLWQLDTYSSKTGKRKGLYFRLLWTRLFEAGIKSTHVLFSICGCEWLKIWGWSKNTWIRWMLPILKDNRSKDYNFEFILPILEKQKQQQM